MSSSRSNVNDATVSRAGPSHSEDILELQQLIATNRQKIHAMQQKVDAKEQATSQRIHLQGGQHPLSASNDSGSQSGEHDATISLPLHPLPLDPPVRTPSHRAEPTERPPAHQLQNAGTEARNVRRNMFMAAWNGFTVLAKSRKWILILRLIIGLAQLVLGIVILSLPGSKGDSALTTDTCNPQGMFVYLTLHIIRAGFSIPVDFYLGLSPHRTPSARRAGSEGQSDRERNRTVGSLALDRKLSRVSDLLGLCHVVLFIVGNYVVWTNIACNNASSRSRPLWIACVCMLSVTYTIIFEVMLMIFVSRAVDDVSMKALFDVFLESQLLVFFLPLLLALLRALGLAIPQRAIRPETGKIDQDDIEKQSSLVYFTLAKDEEAEVRSSREDLERLDLKLEEEKIVTEESREAVETPLPLSRTNTTQSKAPSQRTATPHTNTTPGRRRMGLLFGFARRRTDEDQKRGSASKKTDDAKNQGGNPKGKSKERLKYPIYPVSETSTLCLIIANRLDPCISQVPAHRATCPICLCDFEELATKKASNSDADAEAEAGLGNDDDKVEPLRLLKCGHLMHMACVD
jgi:hypothetical protein